VFVLDFWGWGFFLVIYLSPISLALKYIDRDCVLDKDFVKIGCRFKSGGILIGIKMRINHGLFFLQTIRVGPAPLPRSDSP
jgi:hypothetical protein